MKSLTKSEFCDLAERNEDLKRAKREIQQKQDEPWRTKQDITAVSDMRYDRVSKARRVK